MAFCANCGHDNREQAKFCEECGAALAVAVASNEQRKIVTILFCDLAGSTELGESTDPEALRALLASYFERMKAIVESHGGSVEKFIGDAVMAVFGVPLTHEDDALRACRSAVEMRDALPELGVRGRIGVNTRVRSRRWTAGSSRRPDPAKFSSASPPSGSCATTLWRRRLSRSS